MKKLITAAVLTLGMIGVAAADETKAPTMMTDTQMDSVVAGLTMSQFMNLLALNGLQVTVDVDVTALQ